MLADINETNKNGGDVSACIAKYREKYTYVYVYNDSIFKILFGNPENERMTVDFLNAVLDLYGSDCIEHITFENPAVPSAFSKEITSDIVMHDRNQDRIVSLQMFNGFPESSNYRHHVRLKNQDNEEFYKKQTITLVEIPKFLKSGYESDNSMLAQWLRVIDGINKEQPVPVPEGSLFALLHEKAKLCIFIEEFLVSEAMSMSDRNYELYVEKKHARAEGKTDGHADAINVMKAMNLPPEKIAEAKAMLAELANE